MQDLLKDHFVERVSDGKRNLSLTCSVCGAVWSNKQPLNGNTDLEIRKNAVREAMELHRMCTFCARPVCLNCFENVEDISLCVQCGKQLRERVGQETIL